jgi:hypothetical protein
MKQQNKWAESMKQGTAQCDSLTLTYKKGPKYSRWARVGKRFFFKRTVPPLLDFAFSPSPFRNGELPPPPADSRREILRLKRPFSDLLRI